jgi:uracil-DNA glycosylase
MNINNQISCKDFPCTDVRHECYIIPHIDVDPEKISVVLISEAAPPDPADTYYSEDNPLFQQTTVLAFKDAGAQVDTLKDILEIGVYCTAAVKCGKTGYGIQAKTVKTCSFILERELAQFPNVQVLLLMGDVAIKAVNEIARRNEEGRVIPAGSTYKLRGQDYTFHGIRALPSYLQAGPSFFIEKVKRKMIAEDISTALRLVGKAKEIRESINTSRDKK